MTDARENDLVRTNLAVVELGVVAYAGFPIFDQNGRPVGALCAIDSVPRQWTASELGILQRIAEQVASEVALRESLIQMGVDLAAMRESERARSLVSRADRHDLRTPLNAMLLSMQAVKQFGPLNADQEEFLETAENNLRVSAGNGGSAHRHWECVDSRGMEALEMVPTNAWAMIRRAADQVRPLAHSKGIELRHDGQVSEQVVADVDKTVRVLVNLLANGIKFTPSGGTVSVSTRRYVDEGKPALLFTIEDTGIGVAEEHIARLFDEGFRVEAQAPTRRSDRALA